MENLNENCFAYPSMRKYPIHTKEAALNSHDEFIKEASRYPRVVADQIEANFEKAASYHEITWSAQEKVANLERESFLFKGGSENVEMTKIASESDHRAAVDWILEKRASSHREDLQEPAKYALWYASEHGLDMNTPEMLKIARIAGIGVCDREKVQYEFDKRAFLIQPCKKDREAFWSYSKELQSMSDEDFYKEATLNKICNVLEYMDIAYDTKYRYGKDLQAPEDVVFEKNASILIAEANDLLLVGSIDTVLSKKALLERKNAVNSFFTDYFGAKESMEDAEMVKKVASLDADTAEALLERIN